MIGFQDIVIKNNIKILKLAKEVGVSETTIWGWIRTKVPERRLNQLAKMFNVDEEYLNKQVNNISTYKANRSGFTNKYKIDGDTTIIYLRKKNGLTFETLIDTEDLPRLIKLGLTWNTVYDKKIKDYYVRSCHNKKTYYLHRVIMNVDNTKDIVHHKQPGIKYNSLDNRKYNLEVTTNSRNMQLRAGANKNNKTGVRNVSYIESENVYWVQMMKDGERFKRVFPANQFDEACEFARQKRIELFGKE